MNNDLKIFIPLTERKGFDENQQLKSNLFRDFNRPIVTTDENIFSLLELYCYYGAVDSSKFLRTKFSSKITKNVSDFHFWEEIQSK